MYATSGNPPLPANLATSTRRCAVLLFTGLAGLLLWLLWCLYTREKIGDDQAVYTNFLWNSAHGELFRFSLDHTYLRSHLSWTVLLLAPLFRIWDNAFLLCVVQALLGAGGATLIFLTAVRHRLPSPLPLVLGLFFVLSPYGRYVLVTDFHGVSLYMALVPWLYHALCFRRHRAWLPLLLILGVREDAAFVALPMLLYFAIVHRWRPGYAWAAFSVLYAVVAVFVLYPWINGFSLFTYRATETDAAHGLGGFFGPQLVNRLRGIGWFLAPMLPFLLLRAAPPLSFPAAAFAALQCSPVRKIHMMLVMYAAPVFPPLVCGMIESAARARRPVGRTMAIACSAWLVAYMLASPFVMNRHPWIPYARDSFRFRLPRADTDGLLSLDAARRLPREGVLSVEPRLAGFCANRSNMRLTKSLTNGLKGVDLLFVDLGRMVFSDEVFAEALDSDAFGLVWFNYRHVILQRGLDPATKRELLWARANRRNAVVFAKDTVPPPGEDVFVPRVGVVRYWDPGYKRRPAIVGAGWWAGLDAGDYLACFRIRVGLPGETLGGAGRFGLYRFKTYDLVTEVDIDSAAAPPGEFGYQVVPFHLDGHTRVEPRITGGAAPLWLDRVIFCPASGEHPPFSAR